MAQLAGFLHHAKSPKPDSFAAKVTCGGLLTISRFPIIEKDWRSYKSGKFSDAIADKGVLYTQIKIQDQILYLFNTHLQATYLSTDTNEIKESLDLREEQLEILRTFINEKVDNGPKGLVMVVGDFNINSSGDTIAQELKE